MHNTAMTVKPARTALNCSVTTTPRGTVVHINGDAGVSNTDALSLALLPVSASRPALVVLDLAGLNFISSLGLGLLLEFRSGIARNGGTVRVANPQQHVRDMLIKCKFEVVLPIYDTVDAALKAVE